MRPPRKKLHLLIGNARNDSEHYGRIGARQLLPRLREIRAINSMAAMRRIHGQDEIRGE